MMPPGENVSFFLIQKKIFLRPFLKVQLVLPKFKELENKQGKPFKANLPCETVLYTLCMWAFPALNEKSVARNCLLGGIFSPLSLPKAFKIKIPIQTNYTPKREQDRLGTNCFVFARMSLR